MDYCNKGGRARAEEDTARRMRRGRPVGCDAMREGLAWGETSTCVLWTGGQAEFCLAGLEWLSGCGLSSVGGRCVCFSHSFGLAVLGLDGVWLFALSGLSVVWRWADLVMGEVPFVLLLAICYDILPT